MKFFNHMTFGQYVPAESPVHGLDPRCKILVVLVILTGIFMAKHPAVFAAWGVLLAGLTLAARLPTKLVLGSAKPVLILALFTASIHIFFTKGEPLFSLGIINITSEGLVLALYMGLRLIFLVLFASFLTLTTRPMELADGLERLFSPFARFGFPAHELAMMMTIALRFIPTLLDETDRIMKAQLARGASFDRGGLWKRLKAFIPVLIPLFVIVFQRAEDLAVAMEARNYRGGAGRTRMNPLRWRGADTAALILVPLAVFILVYADRSLA
ncbi:MAG: energy-coupling factor transporter transmembrane component T family protein [Aminivibrio sp.]|jgi:energy-coupling factor transport system permease protein|nr:energy-coupling factor transporter transmembrane protein EcfT [Synergistaceae bacterium]